MRDLLTRVLARSALKRRNVDCGYCGRNGPWGRLGNGLYACPKCRKPKSARKRQFKAIRR